MMQRAQQGRRLGRRASPSSSIRSAALLYLADHERVGARLRLARSAQVHGTSRATSRAGVPELATTPSPAVTLDAIAQNLPLYFGRRADDAEAARDRARRRSWSRRLPLGRAAQPSAALGTRAGLAVHVRDPRHAAARAAVPDLLRPLPSSRSVRGTCSGRGCRRRGFCAARVRDQHLWRTHRDHRRADPNTRTARVEAARAMGLSAAQVMRRIVLPSAAAPARSRATATR